RAIGGSWCMPRYGVRTPIWRAVVWPAGTLRRSLRSTFHQAASPPTVSMGRVRIVYARSCAGPLACDGGATSAGLEQPVPSLASVSPDLVTLGAQSVELELEGARFTEFSEVVWNGSSRPTSFVAPTRLRVGLTAGDVVDVGYGVVEVRNRGPG